MSLFPCLEGGLQGAENTFQIRKALVVTFHIRKLASPPSKHARYPKAMQSCIQPVHTPSPHASLHEQLKPLLSLHRFPQRCLRICTHVVVSHISCSCGEAYERMYVRLFGCMAFRRECVFCCGEANSLIWKVNIR